MTSSRRELIREHLRRATEDPWLAFGVDITDAGMIHVIACRDALFVKGSSLDSGSRLAWSSACRGVSESVGAVR